MDYETPDMLVRVQDQVTIVRLRAATLTSMNDVTRINGTLAKIVDDGARRVVLDFKNVRQVGSAALGVMISLQKHLKELGGRLVLSHTEHVDELLRVSQTARLFEIAPDSKAAFKLVKG